MSRFPVAISMLMILTLFIPISTQVKKQGSSISQVEDIKDFKKLMRSKTNVLVIYINSNKEAKTILKVFKEVAEKLKGRATLVSIDCSGGEGKKLCKKLKTDKAAPYYIKHYKDGEFNKNYERAETVNSIVNFLLDPTGDIPWDEDPTATDVYHLADAAALLSFLKKGAATQMNALIMFYAPWCGYCKILKPEYAQAATDVKGEGMLAAIDVSKPDNAKLRTEYNITGFPTLLLFEKGRFRTVYSGENKREALVKYVKDPKEQPRAPEPPESWQEDTQLQHLTMETFDSMLQQVDSALVVFYAPWCGHCKNLKPNLVKAQDALKKQKIEGMIAVVDVTAEKELGSRFNVKGYPSTKYFSKGEYQYDVNHRTDDKIIEFMKNPQEPVAPPPEKPWSEEESAVRHLNAKTFKQTLRKVKHALVMFYAPWCGHCKSTKPEFVSAAERFAEDLVVLFGAVDCTVEAATCATFNVKGYPTFKYFSHYDRVVDYTGGRKMVDFVKYIHTQIEEQSMKRHDSTGFGVSVVLATDDNYEQIFADAAPSFVMFHATWCSHCNEAKPSFSRLATQLKTENAPLKIVAIDVTNNPKVTDFAGIKTLPTFKMYANSAEVAAYEGDRSQDDMYKFCKKAIKVNDEL
ncbi:unnamed protein product [Leptosia nina]|uniref:Thioredoxin domain-containing protein n=1 Tax=Leptosia nina TaxID=320188 RepID=A0AAV1K2I0_9NEOP